MSSFSPSDYIAGGLSIPNTFRSGKFIPPSATQATSLSASVFVSASTGAHNDPIKSVVIRALSTNVSGIWVGPSAVTSANGYRLDAKDAIAIEIDSLAKVFISVDNASATDGVTWAATQVLNP